MLCEATLMVVLGLLCARYHQTFMRWRSLVLGVASVGHSLVSHQAAWGKHNCFLCTGRCIDSRARAA